MNIAIIVQARMTSTRLPGKVLKTVLGKTLLEYQIERLQRVTRADQVVVATTTNQTDDPIAVLCQQLGIACFRGSEQDVLERYYQAAVFFKADIIVRVTSDCPLIDPEIIDRVINYYLKHQADYDYVTNSLMRTYPRGMDTEVLSLQVLENVFMQATLPAEREHVTLFINTYPERFRRANICHSHNLSVYRWTVDTAEDFELIKNIIETVYPRKQEFTLDDIVDQFFHHPEWMKINAHVEQKHV